MTKERTFLANATMRPKTNSTSDLERGLGYTVAMAACPRTVSSMISSHDGRTPGMRQDPDPEPVELQNAILCVACKVESCQLELWLQHFCEGDSASG